MEAWSSVPAEPLECAVPRTGPKDIGYDATRKLKTIVSTDESLETTVRTGCHLNAASSSENGTKSIDTAADDSVGHDRSHDDQSDTTGIATVKGDGYFRKLALGMTKVQNTTQRREDEISGLIFQSTYAATPANGDCAGFDISVLTENRSPSKGRFIGQEFDESLLVTPVLDRYRLESGDGEHGIKVVPNQRTRRSSVSTTVHSQLIADVATGAKNVQFRKTPHPKKHVLLTINEDRSSIQQGVNTPAHHSHECSHDPKTCPAKTSSNRQSLSIPLSKTPLTAAWIARNFQPISPRYELDHVKVLDFGVDRSFSNYQDSRTDEAGLASFKLQNVGIHSSSIC